MSKLPALVRAPPVDLKEAKAIAESVRKEQEPCFDVLEVFGASGSVTRGFENVGLSGGTAFDVRFLERFSGTGVYRFCLVTYGIPHNKFILHPRLPLACKDWTKRVTSTLAKGAPH